MSKVIPRNFENMDGPSTFSSVKGMLNRSHTCLSKFCLHEEDYGGQWSRNHLDNGDQMMQFLKFFNSFSYKSIIIPNRK